MSPNEIKSFFARKGLKHTEVALAIGEARIGVSQVLNYLRDTPRIRKKLKAKYRGLSFDDRHLRREDDTRAA